MKILLVSDEECLYLWDYYRPGRLDGIDLILSCGDLNAEYLSFLVTMGRAPVLYVHGNHDGGYDKHPPEGCTCIEDQVVCVGGLRILGLGGSPWYSGGPHQYTEREMERRIRRLRYRLYRTGRVDIVVTHAPARGYGDEEAGPTRASPPSSPCWTSTPPNTWSTAMSTPATAWAAPGAAAGRHHHHQRLRTLPPGAPRSPCQRPRAKAEGAIRIPCSPALCQSQDAYAPGPYQSILLVFRNIDTAHPCTALMFFGFLLQFSKMYSII